MRFISTRGQASAVGFSDAVLGGLAPDGGLYMPEAWPQLGAAEIRGFLGRPYADVAARIIGAFADGEIAEDMLAEMCAEAYGTFDHAAVVPLVQLAPGAFLAELFHGPSLAFKDVAMQILARLYDHLLVRQDRSLTILCATSGDTGGAAVEAFRGRTNVKLVALFPEGRISEVQRRFMTTAEARNIACVAVAGTFDDCQAIVKDAFQDPVLRQAVDLSGVNSINFARIAAQAVYYFTAAVALGAPDRAVAFVTPSGNFGDAFAGYAAKRMGLPISRIVAATNANDILARAFAEGRYARAEVQATISPAMDIQAASNFERLYFEAVRRDPVATARAFQAFATAGAIDIPPVALAVMHELFAGVSVGEDEVRRTMLATLEATGELIDPHTAVGVAALARSGELGWPAVVLSTAHPAKFPDDVAAVTGVRPGPPRRSEDLAGKPERYDRLPADAEAIKAYVRAFAEA
ncbi:MAG TPA: threonine synthase [Phenylobacterium sp.]|uniref:threonine synthase n=1 Tax=Phenylobacterium sp. TaxID=1871053 RepID=UPI002CBF1D0E|nr:threonine synthase [Phenylobacterium sp.]HSV03952.1 threonine synthase [Phenylobacterium sp.]